MKKDTIEIIHDMMITDHVMGVLLGQVFAYNSIISTFERLNLQKQKAVINKLLKLKEEMEESIALFGEQMAALQSQDREVRLFLNKNYQDDVKALRKGIALVDKMLS